MKYIKRNERYMKAAAMFKMIVDNGGTVKDVAEYSKWHNLPNGRIQVTLKIMKMEANVNTGYILEDNLGMIASYAEQDLNEIKSFLANNGFKPIKDWYIQDCGMSEETWKEWNSSND